jgi:hypothetical protein
VQIILKSHFNCSISCRYRAIVKAVDGLFSQVEKFSFGKNGVVSKFSAPVVATSLANGLNAGKSSNPISKTRNAVVGAMRGVIDSYNDESGDLTVADLIAMGLNDVLNEINVLVDDVTTTYFEVDAEGIVSNYSDYDREKNITSLMWTIPLGTDVKILKPCTYFLPFPHVTCTSGQKYTFALPELDFQLGNDGFPLQIYVDSGTPELSIEWQFKIAFGFDEQSG